MRKTVACCLFFAFFRRLPLNTLKSASIMIPCVLRLAFIRIGLFSILQKSNWVYFFSSLIECQITIAGVRQNISKKFENSLLFENDSNKPTRNKLRVI